MAVERTGVNVSELINTEKIGWGAVSVVAWCFALLVFDGYDFVILGNVAPSIVKDWGVARSAFAPVFAAGVFGLIAGALLFGPVADRFGRRRAIILAGIVFGIFTFASAGATSLGGLMILRFFASVGLGGVNPNAIALVSEYVPDKRRATAIAIAILGFTGGGALGGFIAAQLLRHYDWPAVFIVGGVVPIVIAIVMYFFIPESVRLLALRPGNDLMIARALRKVFPHRTFADDAHYYVTEEEPRGFPVIQLFQQRRAPVTTLLWLGQFTNQVVILFLNSWLPILITSNGIPIADAVQASAMVQVGGVVGGLLFSPLLDLFGIVSIGIAFTLAALAVAALGMFGTAIGTIALLAFIAGFFVLGGQLGQTGVIGIVYPPAIRATGAGWAIGIGRWGAVLGPILGGVLVADKLPSSSLFAIAAIPDVFAAASFFVLSALKCERDRE